MLPRPAPVELEAADPAWPDHAGTYLNVKYGRLASIRVRHNQLWYEQGQELRPLVPIERDRYYVRDRSGAQLPIAFTDGAEAPSEYLFVGGEPFRRFKPGRVPDPDRASLARCVGVYRDPSSMDPLAGLEVRIERDQLWVKSEGVDEPLRTATRSWLTSRCDGGTKLLPIAAWARLTIRA